MFEPDIRSKISLVGDEQEPTVRVERHLPHPCGKVWAALTNEAQLAVWYPTSVQIDPVAGGSINFRFPDGEPFYGTVLEVVAERLLRFSTREDILTWRLADEPGGSLLTLENAVGDPEHAPYTAAGFDISFRQLSKLLGEGPEHVRRYEMPPPEELVQHYRAEFERSHA